MGVMTMPAQISEIDMENFENEILEKAKTDGDFMKKLRSGAYKFYIEPGEKVSRLHGVDMSKPENVKKYKGQKLYNTPQEAEHFTEGFGSQPTREGGLFDMFINQGVIPRYQHQIHDPIRKFTKDPVFDIGQDVLSTARYATPLLGLTGVGALPVAAATAALGAASKGLGAAIGEEELQDTWENILSKAAAAGASVGLGRYFSEEAVRNRKLKDEISKSLKIPKEQVTDDMIQSIKAVYNPSVDYSGEFSKGVPGIELKNRIARALKIPAENVTDDMIQSVRSVFDPSIEYTGEFSKGVPGAQMKRKIATALGIKPENVSAELLDYIREPLEARSEKLPVKTYEDYIYQPLREGFDKTFGTDVEVAMERLPMPRMPGKESGTTGAQVMPRGRQLKFTPQEWDAIARKFMVDANIPDANPKDVAEFIKEFHMRPQSQMGEIFAPTKKTDWTLKKGKWTALKGDESLNPVARNFLKEKAYFKDPEVDRMYREALSEFETRAKKLRGKKGAQIVSQDSYEKLGRIMTPKQYESLGHIMTPEKYSSTGGYGPSGSFRSRYGRKGLQIGGALLPLAAQAVLPYVVQLLPTGGEE